MQNIFVTPKMVLDSVSYFFFLYRSAFSSLCIVFDSTSSNIGEVLSFNPFINVFAFGDFNVLHKGRLTYSGGTDRPGELCYISQMILLRWLTFLLGSQTVILTVLLFWISFFLLTLVFVLKWLFSIGKCWSCFFFNFHWLSIKFTTGCPVSSHSLWLFSCLFIWSLWSFERCYVVGCL